jgi:hypothetical protein
VPINNTLISFARHVPENIATGIFSDGAGKKFIDTPIHQGVKLTQDMLKSLTKQEDSFLNLKNSAGHDIAAFINPESTRKPVQEWNLFDKLFFKARLWLDEMRHGSKSIAERLVGSFKTITRQGDTLIAKTPLNELKVSSNYVSGEGLEVDFTKSLLNKKESSMKGRLPIDFNDGNSSHQVLKDAFKPIHDVEVSAIQKAREARKLVLEADAPKMEELTEQIDTLAKQIKDREAELFVNKQPLNNDPILNDLTDKSDSIANELGAIRGQHREVFDQTLKQAKAEGLATLDPLPTPPTAGEAKA